MSDQGFYTVFARKYRPRKFSELVAQTPVSTTLRNALKAEKVYHAYLFTGPRGVGKTTSARILAKALNCPNVVDSDPCGECETCLQIAEGRHSDVLEIDGASNNGIAQVRELRENAAYLPKESRYKIYIIDEVHMLSMAAFNGLLKTLEEPPPHVAFIMATTEPQKIPATVQSRCQRFDFKRLTPEEIGERVRFIADSEGIEIDDEAIYHIGRLAEGSMRDAQSYLDQLVAFCGEKISGTDAAGVLGVVPDELYLECTRLIGAQSAAEVFPFVEKLDLDGYDPTLFLRGYVEHLRTLIALGLGANPPEVRRMPVELRDAHVEAAALLPVGDLVRAVRVVGEAERLIRNASSPRIELEMTLVRLAMLSSTVDLERVLKGLGQVGGSGGGGDGGGGRGGESRGATRASGDSATGNADSRARVTKRERISRGDVEAPGRRPFDRTGGEKPVQESRPNTPRVREQGVDGGKEMGGGAGQAERASGDDAGSDVEGLALRLSRYFEGRKPVVAAALKGAKVRLINAGQVEILVAAGSRSVLPRLQDRETRLEVLQKILEWLRRPVEISIVAASEAQGANAPLPPRTRVPGHTPKRFETLDLEKIAADEPLVQDLLDHFKIG
jgi:DNA polymerase-3 subunit gamma/tau